MLAVLQSSHMVLNSGMVHWGTDLAQSCTAPEYGTTGSTEGVYGTTLQYCAWVWRYAVLKRQVTWGWP
eukprot:3565084-Rhodomonas_salina.1